MVPISDLELGVERQKDLLFVPISYTGSETLIFGVHCTKTSQSELEIKGPQFFGQLHFPKTDLAGNRIRDLCSYSD
jgi:hypothetical protein